MTLSKPPIGTISAIIPTFNRKKQVANAVDSILAQTVPVSEIIVVDDGSTDGTEDCLRKRYGSLITIIYQQNRGVSSARNTGIAAAQGDWVAFLDSDDTWLESKIEQQCQALLHFGSGYGLCFTDCLYSAHPDKIVSAFHEAAFLPSEVMGHLHDPGGHILGATSPLRIVTTIIKRSLFEAVGGFDETVKIMEDMDVFFRLSFRTGFVFCAEPLVHVDRAPSRPLALCGEFTAKNSIKYDTIGYIYRSWLSLDEIAGTEYERKIHRLIRALYYESLGSSLRRCDVVHVLHEITRLRDLDEDYITIISTILKRVVARLLHDDHKLA